MLDWIIAACVLAGAFFTLVGSIGLFKLPDFYMRLHGPTKATTLGVGAILSASVLYFSFSDAGVSISLHEVLVGIFLFITAPVAAHLMAKAALHIKLKQLKRTQGSDVLQSWNTPDKK